MHRRALTLIELIVAVAIVVAAAAVGTPIALRLLDVQRFDIAGEFVQQLLDQARAHAQLTGEVVEVVAWASETETWTLMAQIHDAVDDEREDAEGIDPQVIPEAWATVEMPAGVRVSDTGPMEGGAATTPTVAMDSSEDALRIVVFLPDGSAAGVRDSWITDGASWAAIRVSDWTGASVVSDPVDSGNDEEDDVSASLDAASDSFEDVESESPGTEVGEFMDGEESDEPDIDVEDDEEGSL